MKTKLKKVLALVAVTALASAGCVDGSSPRSPEPGDSPDPGDPPDPGDAPPKMPRDTHFGTAFRFPTGREPRGVALADLDGDGRLDIVIGNQETDTISVLLNTTPVGATSPTFAARVDFATGDVSGWYDVIGSPAVAVVDVDGDGRPDIVAADNRGALSVLMNATVPGSGALAFAARVDFPGIELPSSIAVADFNGDGRPDVAVAANGATGIGPGSVSVFLSTIVGSAPTFGARLDIASDSLVNELVVADFNGDGLPDLAVNNKVSSALAILTNTTAAHAPVAAFAKTSVAGTHNIDALAVADLDGDGTIDLVAAEDAGPNGFLEVFLGTTAAGAATPTFSSGGVQASQVWNPEGLAIADLNGDGKPDVVAGGYSSAGGQMSVWLDKTTPGAAMAAFAGPAYAGDSDGPFVVVFGDINGDGKPDLVATSTDDDEVVVLLDK